MRNESLLYRPQLPETGSLINGQWLAGEGDVAVHDKFNGDVIARVAQATREQVALAVQTAADAAERDLLTPVDRARILRKTADLLERDRDQFVALMVAEAGFTVADAEGDLERSLVTLRLSAEEATRLVGETVAFGATPGQHTRLGMTIRAPLGVVCAITPFNSPLNTVIHKVAPALAGGNGVVLKPSAITPLTSALLCMKLLEAGLPPALLSMVQGEGESTGAWLLDEPRIAFYTFTGSTRVGREIARGAGLRKVQLELGSIASVIVCADADLKKAAPKIANAAFRKAGQVCTSVQRVYVERSALQEMQDLLVAAAKQLPAGDPRSPGTRVGPLISESSAMRVESWIAEAREAGAVAVTGGQPRKRSVLEPTILTNVKRDMKVVEQEVFGPLLSIIPFDDVAEAVRGANDSPYGLAAGFFSSNINKALQAARTLRFGAIHLNETSSCRADGMPFGGVKDSGYGHEGPAYSIREVTEERLITFNL